MRTIASWCAVALLAAACDSGPDYDNTTPYPGPCSSRLYSTDSGVDDTTFEYDQGRLVNLHSEIRHGYRASSDTTRTRGPDGAPLMIELVTTLDDDALEWLWVFDSDFVTEIVQGDTIRKWDRARYAEQPAPGSAAWMPYSELGLIEFDASPCTWTMDGDLQVRTCVNERATFTLDDRGRIVTKTFDTGNDGDVEQTDHLTFDGDLLVRATSERTDNLWTADWRYDLAGNVASMDSDRTAYPSQHEEYDYSCW